MLALLKAGFHFDLMPAKFDINPHQAVDYIVGKK